MINGDPKSSNKTIIWQNPRPSSPRFCRPIRLQVCHETTEISIKEKEYIEKQIEELESSSIFIDEKKLIIKHKMLFTMIDGKVCNAITSTKSAVKCYVYGATSKEFNNLDVMLKKTNKYV